VSRSIPTSVPSLPRRRLAVLAAGVALAATAAAVVPQAADAALPKVGTYAGKTTQPSTIPYTGSVRIKVSKAGGVFKLAKVTARLKMQCQDGDPALTSTSTFSIPSPTAGLVSSSGRFSYTYSTSPTSGVTIKGRFTTSKKATGTIARSDAHSGCYVGNVKWSASLL
jgi:hypothetical protein